MREHLKWFGCSRYVREVNMESAVPSVRSKSKFNVYAAVTQKIVDAIEAGAGEFRCPWHVSGPASFFPTNAATLAEYRGINIVALWVAAQSRGYATGLWASYKQWQSIGAQVRYGETGSLVVFYKRIAEQPFDPDDPNRSVGLRHVARPSWVFNAAQVDGFVLPPPNKRNEVERVAEVEAFVTAVEAKVAHGYMSACYRHATDTIEMPHREQFVGSDTNSPTESYYATLLHELTHWTGAPHRLNRTFGKRFGDDAYAVEELVAELGAAFACAAFGISCEPRPDHAAYISSWLKVLRQNSHAIFTAASQAQEAFEHLCYLATRNEPGERNQATA